MDEPHFTFKTYAWSLGTTSFRMSDFHRKVEEQLLLLDQFWRDPANSNEDWSGNSAIQQKYYRFIREKGLVTGNIQNDPAKQAKTARQKTSGLVQIGLINENRRLSSVGKALLAVVQSGDFRPDNAFGLPSDSYLYFKQLLKTSNTIDGTPVRPYLVIGKLLNACDDYLSDEEFTYLAPLCITEEITNYVIEQIPLVRSGRKALDEVIAEIIFARDNYATAREWFVAKPNKTAADIMTAGMNRDGATHDACYADLYPALQRVYLQADSSPEAVAALGRAVRQIGHKPGALWRKMFFGNDRRLRQLSANVFDQAESMADFDDLFFCTLHLNKVKATLSDYHDLNKRYLNITDTFRFADGKMSFTPLFLSFFKTTAGRALDDAFAIAPDLMDDSALAEINPALIFDEKELIVSFSRYYNAPVQSLEDLYNYTEDERYRNFRELIDAQFGNEVLIDILEKMETRQADEEIVQKFGGEADLPTIFEYVVGVAWYRISGYSGKILDYMNLSLDTALMPRSHAGGGESDIVYKYAQTSEYPAHTLLIECTLMNAVNQRHGEMEPVTRHLMNYMIDEDENAYCAFVTNNLHNTVVSDFRSRKFSPFYRSETEFVESMNIVPLDTTVIKYILRNNIPYARLYGIFMAAYAAEERNALAWRDNYINRAICGE